MDGEPTKVVDVMVTMMKMMMGSMMIVMTRMKMQRLQNFDIANGREGGGRQRRTGAHLELTPESARVASWLAAETALSSDSCGGTGGGGVG